MRGHKSVRALTDKHTHTYTHIHTHTHTYTHIHTRTHAGEHGIRTETQKHSPFPFHRSVQTPHEAPDDGVQQNEKSRNPTGQQPREYESHSSHRASSEDEHGQQSTFACGARQDALVEALGALRVSLSQRDGAKVQKPNTCRKVNPLVSSRVFGR